MWGVYPENYLVIFRARSIPVERAHGMGEKGVRFPPGPQGELNKLSVFEDKFSVYFYGYF